MVNRIQHGKCFTRFHILHFLSQASNFQEKYNKWIKSAYFMVSQMATSLLLTCKIVYGGMNFLGI